MPEEILYKLGEFSLYMCKFEMAAEAIRGWGQQLCEEMDDNQTLSVSSSVSRIHEFEADDENQPGLTD